MALGVATGMVSKEHVLWFILGVLFALFILPMVQQYFEHRRRSNDTG
jgi:hypothetical protein